MIDYGVLARSVEFYESEGFPRIELPWTVAPAFSAITAPLDSDNFIITRNKTDKAKVFVASAEQAFLSAIFKGNLPATGRFQCITPCMRNEEFDTIHQKYFMKNELIIYNTLKNNDEENELDMRVLANIAFSFMIKNGVPKEELDIVKISDHQYDIMFNGIELGSYGIRRHDYVTWIYGTGIAEPRFSNALKRRAANGGLSQ